MNKNRFLIVINMLALYLLGIATTISIPRILEGQFLSKWFIIIFIPGMLGIVAGLIYNVLKKFEKI